MVQTDRRLVVLADDLSGAAEAAAAAGPPASVLLAADGADVPSGPSRGDVAVDLDCRYAAPATAGARTAAALRRATAADGTVTVLVKIDSLLRGNVAAQVRAALDMTGGPVVVAPTLPEHARTVVGGAPLVDGVPLAETAAWRLEDGTPPRHLADLCPEPPVHLDRAAVHDARLPAALARHRLLTCDAVTTDDVATIVRATVVAGGVLVGSSALARAWAEVRPGGAGGAEAPSGRTGTAGRPVPCLTVLGSAAPRIATQVARLDAAHPQTVVEIPAAEVSRWARDPRPLLACAEKVGGALDGGDVTVRMTDTGPDVDPRPLPALLGALVAAALDGRAAVDLVASGGETARSALARLGVRRLDVLEEVHPGAVLSRGDGALGSYVVTRPGGQGGDDSLALVREALRARRAGSRPTTHTLEKKR